MGQVCGQNVICDLDKGIGGGSNDRNRHWSNHAAAQAHALGAEEASRKAEQLALELRMLKDDNYRIREEQLRLEKEGWRGDRGMDRGSFLGAGMDGRGGSFVGVGMEGRGGSFVGVGMEGNASGRGGSFLGVGMEGRGGRGSYGGRPESDQQLSYMKEVIRNLQDENQRLRGKNVGASGSVSEDEYRKLQQQLKSLQQQHLRQVQQQRQMQGSAGVSTAVSGVSTPLSSASPHMEDARLRAQFEALQREQDELRGKVRRLAHMG
mmetsp:Transcript_155/g.343  ORF Transcript_155/g.343 Transcript_155/m.343 type:complete len:264 (+) Transcript_155:52-843(+)